FEHHRGWDFVDRNVLRVYYDQAFDCGEPKFPVARLDSGGMKTTRAFQALHPLCATVGNGTDLHRFAGGNVFQFTTSHAKDSLVAAQPEIAMAIFEDLRNHVVRQAVRSGKGRKLAPGEPRQACAGADPERALRITIDGSDKVAGQAITPG